VLRASLLPTSSDQERWNLARVLLDDGMGWEQTFESASALLARLGEPAAPETVRKSYEKIERSLPPEQRRKRTWRRRKPVG
jgi:hypothetical protein